MGNIDNRDSPNHRPGSRGRVFDQIEMLPLATRAVIAKASERQTDERPDGDTGGLWDSSGGATKKLYLVQTDEASVSAMRAGDIKLDELRFDTP